MTTKATENKIMSAREAVQRFIKPGTHIAFGGFAILRRPMTIAREIVRQGIGDLFVTMNGGTTIEEMLAGAGLIKWLESTYLGMEGGMPVAYAVRLALEQGAIELIEDYSNWSFSLRTIAARYGLPFMPCLSDLGSDLITYDTFGKAGLRGRDKEGNWIHPGIPPYKYVVVDDPFEGWGLRPRQYKNVTESCANKTNAYANSTQLPTAYTGEPGVKVALVPPLLPEVCVIRAQRVAVDGTVRMEGLIGPDIDQSLASSILIVECERICEPDELRMVPEHNQIAPHFVSAIVEQPFGGYPTAVPNYYDYDYDWFQRYGKSIGGLSLAQIRDYWQKEVASTEDDWDYLFKRVGVSRLSKLRTDPRYHYNPELNRFA
ncbi:MAG TPA: hypothetical protein GXX69_02675 [Firmicutes bacterium]|nr:hypothetical protein [Bacillota bacterium]